jgi:hypothetical protein
VVWVGRVGCLSTSAVMGERMRAESREVRRHAAMHAGATKRVVPTAAARRKQRGARGGERGVWEAVGLSCVEQLQAAGKR